VLFDNPTESLTRRSNGYRDPTQPASTRQRCKGDESADWLAQAPVERLWIAQRFVLLLGHPVFVGLIALLLAI
jgi:hypothetical protein